MRVDSTSSRAEAAPTSFAAPIESSPLTAKYAVKGRDTSRAGTRAGRTSRRPR
jgi:hypothetical protein